MDSWWPGYKYSSWSAKINHQPCPHLNSHWKIPASFNTNLFLPLGSRTSPKSGTSPKSPFKFDISYHADGIEELTFHFLRAHYIFLLHLFPDVASISRLSPATQGPVVRGNTHHRFSIYPSEATSLPIYLAISEKPSVFLFTDVVFRSISPPDSYWFYCDSNFECFSYVEEGQLK